MLADREAAGDAPEQPAIRGMTIERVAETRGVSVEALAKQPAAGPRPTAPAPPVATPPRGPASSVPGQLADARARADRAEAQLAEVRADLVANRGRFQRLVDRSDEVRARMERQQQELPERITQQVIEALLPVFDGLDTTVGTLLVGGHLGDDERTALEMLASEQNKALQQLGIQAFDAVGHTFDPAVHDAISEDFRDDVAEGRVVRQVGRGYLLRGRLMRSAQVVIARPSAAEDKG